ncbi:MAG: hypothetical protein ACREQN_08110 [Candidatus Binataceae bacterium]
MSGIGPVASGPGAHEYFGRWFLAWLFTQKLPLYFLSLPYRNGRYTIGSMYAFLNWRFYLGWGRLTFNAYGLRARTFSKATG